MYLVIALALSILIALLSVQNAYLVTVTFLWWSFDMSLVLIILGSTLVGAVLAGVIMGTNVMRMKLQGWELAADNRRLAGELERVEQQLKAKAVEQDKTPQ